VDRDDSVGLQTLKVQVRRGIRCQIFGVCGQSNLRPAADDALVALQDIPVTWAPREVAAVRVQDEWLLLVIDELQARVLEERAAGPVLHDINNVMTALIYEVKAAIDRARTGEGCLDALIRVQAAVGTAASITRGFASIGRARPRACVEVEIGKRLGSLHSVLDSIAGHDVTLGLQVDRGLPRAVMRPDAFDRLILNLVSNAADAVEAGGTILVSARRASVEPGDQDHDQGPREAEYIVLTVADDGCGMAPEVVARAFAPTYSTKREGTGIGLALVAREVQRRGGAVGIRSEPGVGTAIDVYVPAAEARE
jgi:signal transduction histidine kinase